MGMVVKCLWMYILIKLVHKVMSLVLMVVVMVVPMVVVMVVLMVVGEVIMVVVADLMEVVADNMVTKVVHMEVNGQVVVIMIIVVYLNPNPQCWMPSWRGEVRIRCLVILVLGTVVMVIRITMADEVLGANLAVEVTIMVRVGEVVVIKVVVEVVMVELSLSRMRKCCLEARGMWAH